MLFRVRFGRAVSGIRSPESLVGWWSNSYIFWCDSDVAINILTLTICVGKLTIIGSDNGLSPGRRQAIIWTIAGILLIGPSGTNFSEILIGIQTFSFKKMHLKMSSAKWRPFVSVCVPPPYIMQWRVVSCIHGDVMTWKRCLHYWPLICEGVSTDDRNADFIMSLNASTRCWSNGGVAFELGQLDVFVVWTVS